MCSVSVSVSGSVSGDDEPEVGLRARVRTANCPSGSCRTAVTVVFRWSVAFERARNSAKICQFPPLTWEALSAASEQRASSAWIVSAFCARRRHQHQCEYKHDDNIHVRSLALFMGSSLLAG